MEIPARAQVFYALNGERDYQDRLAGGDRARAILKLEKLALHFEHAAFKAAQCLRDDNPLEKDWAASLPDRIARHKAAVAELKVGRAAIKREKSRR